MPKKCTDSLLIKNIIFLHQAVKPLIVLNQHPFSLAMGIVTMCSDTQARYFRLQEVKEMLLACGYTPGIIDAFIAKARTIPRQEALK